MTEKNLIFSLKTLVTLWEFLLTAKFRAFVSTRFKVELR